MTSKQAYRAGIAVACAVAFLQVWMNVASGIVGEDSPGNQGFFGVVVSAAACAWAVRFEAAGMARAMVATAGLQAVLAVALAIAPIFAQFATRVLMLSAAFVALWLISAACFRRSARIEHSY